jgi:GntR family transcriptional regulator/MocR family aminotransferase
MTVEAYGLPEHRRIVAASGLGLSTVPIDTQGATVSKLGDTDAVMLTPAHQFPLGVAMSPRRRTETIRWAADTAGLVIEDDYDGEFRYDRQPVGALQALAPEHVAYVGTASKSLAPGLRLAWLVLPAELTDEVVAAKARADRTNTLDQLTLAEFITSGAYDRHLRRSRHAYRRRRDRLVAALHQHAPDVRVTGVAAGLHAVVELPAGHDENHVIASAAQHDLAIETLNGYQRDDTPHGPALVVGYGTPPEHAFSSAVAKLCAAIRSAPLAPAP